MQDLPSSGLVLTAKVGGLALKRLPGGTHQTTANATD
jgi:hypothetical protein